jgi:hypothetical protein
MTDPDDMITAEMVALGAAALESAYRELGERPIRQYPVSWRRTLSLAVLTAVVPAIRAAERERIRVALMERQSTLAFAATSRFTIAVLVKDIEDVLRQEGDLTL